jgi:hypothetical protein
VPGLAIHDRFIVVFFGLSGTPPSAWSFDRSGAT